MRHSLVLVVFVLTSACDDDGGGGTAIADACNPLGHEGIACLMPWPSAAFLADDPTTSTGFRVAMPIEAMPTNQDDIAVDPGPWNRQDGFSPSGALIAGFPGGVSADGLPPHTDPAASLAADAPVVVVNIETGERLLIFAEVDMNVDPELRTLIIRPLERMSDGARYAVGVRDSVRASDGSALVRSPGFEALVTGSDFDHPRFAQVSAGAGAMFAALAEAGVPKESLVLAWDFVTASDESLTSDLLTMRDQALPAMGDAGENLGLELEPVAANSELVHTYVIGTYDAPNFLSAGESNYTAIVRDAGGAPSMDGMFSANLAVIVPACVTTSPLPLEVVLFGHGLFGSAADYAEDDLLRELASDNCLVVVAGDWIGLSKRQLSLAAFSANDLNRSNSLSEMLGQSVINFIALEHLIRGPLAAAPEMQFEGTPILDPTRVYYLGGSLGGIMGGAFMAYDPVITRGVLGVPGGAWSMLIERSTAWSALQVAAQGAYQDPYSGQILLALLAHSFERWDPITTARKILVNPLPDTPVKQLLLYETLNDALVTNLSTELLARTMGLMVTSPSVKSVYGLEESAVPEASALTIYDEHATPEVPLDNVPPAEDNGTHSGVNSQPVVLRAALRFLRDGEAANECMNGEVQVACDCATGACD